MTSEPAQPDAPKWQTRFFTIWFGQAFSMLGSHLVGFAFVWYLTEKTGSATILTLGSLMQILPSIVIAPIAGAFVDRWNRKVVMAVFDGITALFTFFVAIMFLLDYAQIWHIFLAMFIRSACGQFQWAAMTASTSLMVPKQHLPRIAGANQSLQGIMIIIAPALGAFLIATMSMQGILLIDVSTAIFAIGSLLFFKIPHPVRNGTKVSPKPIGKTSVFQDLKEGWKYVTSWTGLMAIIFLAMLANLLINPAFSLLPLVVTEHFGKGAYELGFINSAFGVGVIIGGLVLSAWGGFKNQIITSLVALTISGSLVLAIGLASSNMYLLALAAMAIFGFLNPMVNGPMLSVMQTNVEPEIQGRVFSFLQAGATLAIPIGLAIAGPVADATNNQLWFIIGGISTLIVGIASFFVPAIIGIGKDVDQGEKNPISDDEITATQTPDHIITEID
ncbi:MAG: MFS transporter [Chloroflexota bacterium]|nr:MFS transporter [Chloroflexota bacterium]